MKVSVGRDRRSFAVLLALIPLLCLAGCAADRDVARPQDAIADPGDGSERSGNDSAEGAPAEDTATDSAESDVLEGMLFGSDETELSDSPFFDSDDESSIEEPVVDPAILAAEALETCESARIFWEEGDIEEALAALDRAYELLLEIPDDDPDIVQQKEDLRHLISRRIVEIYRSRLTSAVDLDSPIPVEHQLARRA